MVAYKAGTVQRFLNSPDPACRAVLLYGPDAGLVTMRGAALPHAVGGEGGGGRGGDGAAGCFWGGREGEILQGNALPIGNIPLGTLVHTLRPYPQNTSRA